jgi:hypothetical protein
VVGALGAQVSRPVGAQGVAGQGAGVQVGERVECSTCTSVL